LEQPKPEDNEEASSSQTLQDLKDNPDYVVVTVDATNTFHVESSAFDDIIECPSEQELLVKLRQAKVGDSQGNIPTKMLVLGNGEALHERVVMALDAGSEVGMEDVQLMLVEGDDEGG
jgi:biopolymer transport protein ExbD